MADCLEKCKCNCHSSFGETRHIMACCNYCSYCNTNIRIAHHPQHVQACENKQVNAIKKVLVNWDGLIYAHETIPKKTKTIFLAGPTPRDPSVRGWRLNAIYHMVTKRFDGKVLIPEPRDGKWLENYDAQIEWEAEALRKATVLLFWIPRDLSTTPSGELKMPAFTTNDEWGVYKATGKVVLGVPDDAPNTRYQLYYANKYKVPVSFTLEHTCANAIELAKKNYWG